MSVVTGVMERCDALAACTDEPGRITRTFLSPAMKDAHELVRGWMEAAGMAVRVDAVGNVIGRYEPRPLKRTLLLGSHLDTVPNGGKYDGILGVVLGIATVEELKRSGQELPFAIDVIGFSEEEGVRFSTPYLGSRAVAGTFDPRMLGLKDKDGVSVERAVRDFGLDPGRIPLTKYDRANVVGYVETHIEQGPVLEAMGVPVGVVTAIAGQSKLTVSFAGQAGHAGTVPMDKRRDALAGAAEWISEVERLARCTTGLVATVGQITADPGATNVIPRTVKASLDVRHADDRTREDATTRLLDSAKQIAERRDLTFSISNSAHQPAVPMDGRLSESLRTAAAGCGIEPIALPSGAGHDAAIMASLCPVAMLFVRNPGGISHHPDESVSAADVEAARKVLVSFVQRLADRV